MIRLMWWGVVINPACIERISNVSSCDHDYFSIADNIGSEELVMSLIFVLLLKRVDGDNMMLLLLFQ